MIGALLAGVWVGAAWGQAAGPGVAAGSGVGEGAEEGAEGVSAADALDDATRPLFMAAEAERAARRPAQAAELYRMVLAGAPDFMPASLGLGQALVEAGQVRPAIALYRGLGDLPEALEALARLLEADAPAEALRLWKRVEAVRLGDPAPHCAQARLLLRAEVWATPARGAIPAAEDMLDAALTAWNTCTLLLEGREPEAAVFLALVNALEAAGRSEAEGLMAGYVESWPQGAAAGEARARLDRLDVERAALQWALPADQPLTPGQVARAGEGLLALAEGRAAEAERIGVALVAEAPRSAQAHGLVAEALSAQGRWADAEAHAVVARNLAPDDADARLRLGMLLRQAYGGRRDAEAVEELREAAALRPEAAALRYPLGLAEQAMGNWEAAIRSYEAFLSWEGAGGEEREEARARLESLRRAIPTPPPAPEVDAGQIPADAAARYRIALELFRRGRQEEGQQELAAALALAPEATALLNRQARLLLATGDEEGALTVWERSLEIDPSQGAVQLLLGELAERRGFSEEAERRYRRAAEAGQADARFLLARLSADRGDWDQVAVELAAWRAISGRASPYREAAGELERQVRQRRLLIQGGAAAAILVGLGLPVLIWARRRTAGTLRSLLDGAPEGWHDAARALSALRHEVLKHNTTVLPDVADALEQGDDRPLLALLERTPALLERFEAHLDALEVLARRYRLRIDLRHRDPILAPMYRAMLRLGRLGRGRVAHGGALGAAWGRILRAIEPLRLPDPAELRALSQAINGEGYARLGRIVREICVLPITPALIRETYARVCGEPGIAGTQTPEIEIRHEDPGGAGGPLAVRIFRNDIEDILANLLRNALAAGATRLSVTLTADDDPITGFGMVELRIADDAPGRLTDAMIRGRYIGRGLGLAVDLINRYEGAIRVRSLPGADTPSGSGVPGALQDGSKEIIVQLPRVEADGIDGGE